MPLRPTERQLIYLRRGLNQPEGKLSLFDDYGQEFSHETVEACIRHGWAEPWFDNPINPDWVVCRLTGEGAQAIEDHAGDEPGKNKEESSN